MAEEVFIYQMLLGHFVLSAKMDLHLEYEVGLHGVVVVMQLLEALFLMQIGSNVTESKVTNKPAPCSQAGGAKCTIQNSCTVFTALSHSESWSETSSPHGHFPWDSWEFSSYQRATQHVKAKLSVMGLHCLKKSHYYHLKYPVDLGGSQCYLFLLSHFPALGSFIKAARKEYILFILEISTSVQTEESH